MHGVGGAAGHAQRVRVDLAEATAHEKKLSNAWNNEDAIDSSRRKTEETAFVELVNEIEKKWRRVAGRYGPPLAQAAEAQTE